MIMMISCQKSSVLSAVFSKFSVGADKVAGQSSNASQSRGVATPRRSTRLGHLAPLRLHQPSPSSTIAKTHCATIQGSKETLILMHNRRSMTRSDMTLHSQSAYSQRVCWIAMQMFAPHPFSLRSRISDALLSSRRCHSLKIWLIS